MKTFKCSSGRHTFAEMKGFSKKDMNQCTLCKIHNSIKNEVFFIKKEK